MPALSDHLGIRLSLHDFFHQFDNEGEIRYIPNGLEGACVNADSRLLVITCMYEDPDQDAEEMPDDWPRFEVALDSIQFHLIEADK